MADELDRILNDLRDDLKGLSRVLQSTFRIFDKGNKGEAEHQKQVNEQRRKFLDILKKEGKITEDTYNAEIKNTTATKKSTSAIGNATTKLDSFADSLGLATKGSLKELGAGFVNTAKNFGLADRKIDGFGDALKGFDGLQLLGIKLSDLGDTLDFNVGIFKQLSQTGAGFGKSVIQLRNAATSANMPILDFVDLISTNSTTFARLFGTIMDGMPTIQGFTRALRTRTQNELAEFGLNLDETSEFLATQLEIQRATGQADKIRNQDLVTQTVEYAKNLARLSKLTGVSVKELDEQNRAASVNGTFQATLAGMSGEQADRIRTLNAALEKTNPAFAQLLKEQVAFGVPITDASKMLGVLSQGTLPDLMNSFKAGQITQEQFFNAARDASNILNTDFAKGVAQAGMLGMQGADEALGAIAQMAGATTSAVDDQMTAQGDNTKALVAFGDTIDTLKVQAESISTDVFGKIINSAQLGKAFDAITGAAQGLAGDSLLGNFSKAFDSGLSALRVTIAEKAGAAKEFLFKGEDGKNLIDNTFGTDPNKSFLKQMFPGIFKEGVEFNRGNREQREALMMFNGSDGFQDFGSGTPAMLHGVEAVVPQNDMGQLAKVIEQMSGNATADAPKGAPQGTSTTENYLAELVELNKNAQRALNTLVTIGAMTEKNTKNTKNNLANMGGSLV